jgi:hypothetical protein
VPCVCEYACMGDKGIGVLKWVVVALCDNSKHERKHYMCHVPYRNLGSCCCCDVFGGDGCRWVCLCSIVEAGKTVHVCKPRVVGNSCKAYGIISEVARGKEKHTGVAWGKEKHTGVACGFLR